MSSSSSTNHAPFTDQYTDFIKGNLSAAKSPWLIKRGDLGITTNYQKGKEIIKVIRNCITILSERHHLRLSERQRLTFQKDMKNIYKTQNSKYLNFYLWKSMKIIFYNLFLIFIVKRLSLAAHAEINDTCIYDTITVKKTKHETLSILIFIYLKHISSSSSSSSSSILEKVLIF